MNFIPSQINRIREGVILDNAIS